MTFFRKKLLYWNYNLHKVNCAYLKYTVWWVWQMYTFMKITTTINVQNISITLKIFLMPLCSPSLFLFLVPADDHRLLFVIMDQFVLLCPSDIYPSFLEYFLLCGYKMFQAYLELSPLQSWNQGLTQETLISFREE